MSTAQTPPSMQPLDPRTPEQLEIMRNRFLDQHRATIAEHGFSIQGVGGHPERPSYGYTIGLFNNDFELYCPTFELGVMDALNEVAAKAIQARQMLKASNGFLNGSFVSETTLKDNRPVKLTVRVLDINETAEVLSRMGVFAHLYSFTDLSADFRILEVTLG